MALAGAEEGDGVDGGAGASGLQSMARGARGGRGGAAGRPSGARGGRSGWLAASHHGGRRVRAQEREEGARSADFGTGRGGGMAPVCSVAGERAGGGFIAAPPSGELAGRRLLSVATRSLQRRKTTARGRREVGWRPRTGTLPHWKNVGIGPIKHLHYSTPLQQF